MRRLIVVIVMTLAGPPVIADDAQRFAAIGDFTLVSGEVLQDARVGYRILGKENADRSNSIVVPTWFTGTSAGLIESGRVGPGKLADTDNYLVIVFDAFGNGVSSSPSNSRTQSAARFPSITIEDMVRAQHLVLTEHLGIDHVKAVIGVSMGGMQAFQWMTTYPDFMDKAIPIDGSPRMTSYDIIQWRTHKELIESMCESGRSDEEIMAILSPLNELTLWTPDFFLDFVPIEELDEYLQRSLENYSRIDPYDYVSQLDAMVAVDLLGSTDEGWQRYIDSVSAKVLVIGSSSDHMVNPAPARELAERMDVEYMELHSNCGHLGSACELAEVTARVHEFLSD